MGVHSKRRGWGKDQGLNEHNGFEITQWVGPAGPISNDSNVVRDDVAKALVQTLAPFLIVAEPNVFFSYAWFYNIEDGYIPCPGNVTINGINMDIEYVLCFLFCFLLFYFYTF